MTSFSFPSFLLSLIPRIDSFRDPHPAWCSPGAPPCPPCGRFLCILSAVSAAFGVFTRPMFHFSVHSFHSKDFSTVSPRSDQARRRPRGLFPIVSPLTPLVTSLALCTFSDDQSPSLVRLWRHHFSARSVFIWRPGFFGLSRFPPLLCGRIVMLFFSTEGVARVRVPSSRHAFSSRF